MQAIIVTHEKVTPGKPFRIVHVRVQLPFLGITFRGAVKCTNNGTGPNEEWARSVIMAGLMNCGFQIE